MLTDAENKWLKRRKNLCARVAARLAELVNSEPWPNLWPECVSCERHAKEGDAACPPCVLKEARLAVEAEMKKEKKSCR